MFGGAEAHPGDPIRSPPPQKNSDGNAEQSYWGIRWPPEWGEAARIVQPVEEWLLLMKTVSGHRVSPSAPITTTHLLVLLLLGVLPVLATTGCGLPTPYRVEAGALPEGLDSNPDVAWRVYLVGETAGKRRHVRATLGALEECVSRSPENSTVVFLGSSTSGRVGRPLSFELREQLEAVRETQAIFVAGPLDWRARERSGWLELCRMDDFLADWSRRSPAHEVGDRLGHAGHASLLPPRGAPGPTIVDLPAGHLRIVAIDTQWWLETGDKPGDDPQDVMERLREALRSRGRRRVLVVGHHPMESLGNSAGHASLGQHVFPLTTYSPYLVVPLPIVGSIYWWVTQWSSQSLGHRDYRHMIASLEAAFSVTPPFIYAAAHDRNIQVARGKVARYHLISGAASYHTTPTAHDERTLFASQHPGFLELECTKSGDLRLVVWQTDLDGGGAHPVYTRWLEDPRAPH